jgi:hypothetical protein
MNYSVKSGLVAGLVWVAMSVQAPQAEAGLFKKLFAKCGASSCCEPEPTCCEPAPEPVCCEPAPEPVCEPAPEPVCCEPAPEPVCEPACEPAPEPACCEPAPEPACCASISSMPTLAKGEILISISPLVASSPAKVSTASAKLAMVPSATR